MIERMLEGVEVRLDTDYFENREYFDSIADRVIYTGRLIVSLIIALDTWSIEP